MDNFIMFDVGAHHGEDSLNVAKYDPEVIVYAFEADPKFYDHIDYSRKHGLDWDHYRTPREPSDSYEDRYHIYNQAVSDYDGESPFYIAEGFPNGASSLYKFKDDLDKTWPGRTDFVTEKEILIPVTRLDTWYKNNNIQLDKIDYFHCDAQGCDLKVLQGMGDLIELILEGDVEVARDDAAKLYEENHVMEEMLDFLNEKGFVITQQRSNDAQNNEINLYFVKK